MGVYGDAAGGRYALCNRPGRPAALFPRRAHPSAVGAPAYLGPITRAHRAHRADAGINHISFCLSPPPGPPQSELNARGEVL